MRRGTHGGLGMQLAGGEGEDGDDNNEMVMPLLPLVPSADVLPRAIPPHVLVVDNDVVTRVTLRQLLQAMGCTSNVAVDGSDAVQKIGEQRYDLVLMVPFLLHPSPNA